MFRSVKYCRAVYDLCLECFELSTPALFPLQRCNYILLFSLSLSINDDILIHRSQLKKFLGRKMESAVNKAKSLAHEVSHRHREEKDVFEDDAPAHDTMQYVKVDMKLFLNTLVIDVGNVDLFFYSSSSKDGNNCQYYFYQYY